LPGFTETSTPLPVSAATVGSSTDHDTEFVTSPVGTPAGQPYSPHDKSAGHRSGEAAPVSHCMVRVYGPPPVRGSGAVADPQAVKTAATDRNVTRRFMAVRSRRVQPTLRSGSTLYCLPQGCGTVSDTSGTVKPP